MKKILFILLSVIFAGVANAQFSGTSAPAAGGFEGPGVAQSLTTVKEALSAKDDDDWHGVKATPENTVEIYGEVDKEMFEQTQIDVKSIVVK